MFALGFQPTFLGATSRTLCDFYVYQASKLVARLVNAVLTSAEAQSTANAMAKQYGGTYVCVVSKGASSGPPRAPIKSSTVDRPAGSTCWIQIGSPTYPVAQQEWPTQKRTLKKKKKASNVTTFNSHQSHTPQPFHTPFPRPPQLRVAGVGAVRWLGEASPADVIEARAHLIAWSQKPGVSPPLTNYGKHETEFLNPTTWTERDGIVLHAFANWWNPSHPAQPLTTGTGSIAQAALTPEHLSALRSLSLGGVPAGWQTPPWLSPNVTAQLAAQAWACTLDCQSKFDDGSPGLATCLAACAAAAGVKPPPEVKPGESAPPKTGPESCPTDALWDGTQCQPKLPPPPEPKPAPKPATQNSNKALWVAGGVVVLGVAYLALSSKSG